MMNEGINKIFNRFLLIIRFALQRNIQGLKWKREKNHKHFFPYPMLVCNPLNFKLKLVDQKQYFGFGAGFAVYFLIEECDDEDYVGMYIHSFTNDDNNHIMGKRVRLTFKGLIEDDGKKEDVSNQVIMMMRV